MRRQRAPGTWTAASTDWVLSLGERGERDDRQGREFEREVERDEVCGGGEQHETARGEENEAGELSLVRVEALRVSRPGHENERRGADDEELEIERELIDDQRIVETHLRAVDVDLVPEHEAGDERDRQPCNRYDEWPALAAEEQVGENHCCGQHHDGQLRRDEEDIAACDAHAASLRTC